MFANLGRVLNHFGFSLYSTLLTISSV
jgi:hypothetical protein